MDARSCLVDRFVRAKMDICRRTLRVIGMRCRVDQQKTANQCEMETNVFHVGRGLIMGFLSRARKTTLSAGTTMSSMIGPNNIPPTMTVARGRCTWLPIPVEIAAGTRPIHAEKLVMSIGL